MSQALGNIVKIAKDTRIKGCAEILNDMHRGLLIADLLP